MKLTKEGYYWLFKRITTHEVDIKFDFLTARSIDNNLFIYECKICGRKYRFSKQPHIKILPYRDDYPVECHCESLCFYSNDDSIENCWGDNL